MKFAVMSNGEVSNVIEAGKGSEAALALILPDADEFIAVTSATGPAHIHGDIVDGRFRPAQPFPSWTWDADVWNYVPPVPYPEGGNGYLWDEETTEWIALPESLPAE